MWVGSCHQPGQSTGADDEHGAMARLSRSWGSWGSCPRTAEGNRDLYTSLKNGTADSSPKGD
jgi:hypothetical protein